MPSRRRSPWASSRCAGSPRAWPASSSPQGIHVAHVVVDGGIRSARRPAAADHPDALLDPDAIAETLPPSRRTAPQRLDLGNRGPAVGGEVLTFDADHTAVIKWLEALPGLAPVAASGENRNAGAGREPRATGEQGVRDGNEGGLDCRGRICRRDARRRRCRRRRRVSCRHAKSCVACDLPGTISWTASSSAPSSSASS